MMNLNNQTYVCVCVLNTKLNKLQSHIPPKSVNEFMKNTKL